jgi:hypothetical protein
MAAHPGRRAIHDTLKIALKERVPVDTPDEYTAVLTLHQRAADFVGHEAQFAELVAARDAYLDDEGIAIEALRAVLYNVSKNLALAHALVGTSVPRLEQWAMVRDAVRERTDALVREKRVYLLAVFSVTDILDAIEFAGLLALANRDRSALAALDARVGFSVVESDKDSWAFALNSALRLLPTFLKEHNWPFLDWLYDRGVVARFEDLDKLVKALNDPQVVGYFQRKLASEANDDARSELLALAKPAS